MNDNRVILESVGVICRAQRVTPRSANCRGHGRNCSGGLIKVGWSSDLISRLKHYGPDVVVLCHYPASRQDETLMHRQLRPYLAKGREWYEDCPLIHDVVAGIIKRHGAPYLTAFWTEPKPDAIKKRKRSA